MTLTYGSVCSGIEAASVAWEPLGFSPAWFSEIESFPSAVLQHHWPHVVNLGDMLNIVDMLSLGAIPAPDVLVGGTPCQAFSLAGLRGGLSDSRGQLTLEYVRILNEIDRQRSVPAIAVWENVPGVLSDKSNAFGYFLAGLAGESQPLEPTGRKWTNSGYVLGPQRAVAWRVLDAQYFGVAQRRRRVFVVASARAGFDPAKVLFEFDGVRRDSAPGRETQSLVAALTANGVGTCGADDNQGQAGHLIPCVASTITSAMAKNGGIPAGKDCRPTNLIPEIAGTLLNNGKAAGSATQQCAENGLLVVHGFQPRIARNGRGDMGDVCHTLSAQSGNTGKGDAAPCVAVHVIHGTQDPIVGNNLAHCLGGNGGQENALCYNAYQPQCWRVYDTTVVAPTLQSGEGRGNAIFNHDFKVRRLTPTECERLQGFPDNHTLLPHRPADGPRYKALGNSMAVPVMRWIGNRIKNELRG